MTVQEEQKTAIGIDLGTTNSSIAYVRDGEPYMVPLDQDQW